MRTLGTNKSNLMEQVSATFSVENVCLTPCNGILKLVSSDHICTVHPHLTLVDELAVSFCAHLNPVSYAAVFWDIPKNGCEGD